MTQRALLILVLVAVGLWTHDAAQAAIIDQTIEQIHEVPEKVNLTVRNTNGRIYVYGSEKNRIQITALKRAFTQERVDGIKIKVEVVGDTATIDTIYPPVTGGGLLADRSGTVDYVIVVPQYCTLTNVELANGEVLIEGMRGASIKASVGNGKLLVQNSFALTEATLGNGSINLLYNWWEAYLPISVVAEVADGDIRLGLSGEAVLHLEAETPHGHINFRWKPDLTSAQGDGKVSEAVAADHDDQTALSLALGRGAQDVWTNMKLRAEKGNIRILRAY